VPTHDQFRVRRGILLTLWVASLIVLLAGLGTPVVQRTQEARVLETAREMLTAAPGWRPWVFPELNGEARLQKPPLAYWAAAAGFKLLRVTEFAGRLPFAVAGWLTLALTYRFGARMIDQRFGLVAAAALLTSFMFFRHFRLAETDALATLFVTAAVYWLWRGSLTAGRTSVVRFQLAGLAIGLAAMTKGAPAAFPLLFFAAWAVIERKRAAGTRFLVSGALLTAVLVGGWWYALAFQNPELRAVLKEEASVVGHGENHPQPFYDYFPQLLVTIAPWTGLSILGLVWAVGRWSREPAVRTLVIWGAVILVPLLLIAKRQNHYLQPLGPVQALFAAYALHRALAGDAKERRAAGIVLGATLAVSLLAPAGVIVAARQARGMVQTLDLALIVLLLAGAVGAVSLLRRHGLLAGVFGYATALALVFAVTFGRWLPSLDPSDHRTVAAEMREQFGDGPYVFYGKNMSLPLVWNLRQIVPQVRTREELDAHLSRTPEAVLIAQTKNKREPPPLPPSLAEAAVLDIDRREGSVFRVYVAKP
jgi:4-amino-4-deoxy-L-arabinose transferase-like glycosyltransferase